MELRSLGEIELFGVVDGGEVAELLGEAESAERVAEEVRGGVEVGEVDRLGVDGSERVGEIGSDFADGGLEGGNGGAEGGERDVGVVERGELGEEVVVAREDLVAELRVEEPDRGVELLGGGGRGAGGEGGGGERSGGERWGEEGGENAIGGYGVEC